MFVVFLGDIVIINQKIMQKYILLLSFFILCQLNISAQTQGVIIPKPQSQLMEKGVFDVSKPVYIFTKDSKLKDIAQIYKTELSQYIDNVSITDSKKSKSVNCIQFKLSNKLTSEAYQLIIGKGKIEVIAGSEKGLFYALQSLNQLLAIAKTTKTNLQCTKIMDEPRFSYRGVHLDVSRHFFPSTFIKKYIDALALHKINTFHWHLTDDQGWRIEIKKYPRLTEVGAFRKETLIGHYRESPQQFDGKRYGGFYTQTEIKEIVAYAASKYITIIPEIEMPGHSLAALSAYPELACTTGTFEAATKWGVFEDVFCTKEQTFTFLENVLAEVITLFPSQYIHIGGDECPKERWKTCPNCQAKMKAENLKTEEELQSYFIRRIEKYLNSKGKKIIGWDEILEGGIAPDATIMSWRGTEGGIAAAKQGHNAIMTPGSHCYFDHYQSQSTEEPTAIGGFTSIEKVYAYEPIPEGLTPKEATHILGAQANVWTEYMDSENQVEYMLLPRLAAMSEVLWSPKNRRLWSDFARRLPDFINLLEQKDYNVSKRFFDIQATRKLNRDGNMEVSLFSNQPNAEFAYYEIPKEQQSGDTENPKRGFDPIIQTYKEAIVLNKSVQLEAWIMTKEVKSNRRFQLDFWKHKATGKSITLKDSPSKSFPGASGAATLVDGQKGNKSFNGVQWLGFGDGANMEATIDLAEVQTVKTLKLGVLDDTNNWIHLPKSVSVYASKDGIDFTPISKTEKGDIMPNTREVILPIDVKKFRFFRIIVENHGIIEAGFPGAESGSWLFVDEIILE